MNFFEQQDKARKRSFVLLFFYLLAVLGTIAMVYLAIRIGWLLTLYSNSTQYLSETATPFQFWDARLFLSVSAVVCAVVFLGSVGKVWMLSSGGGAAVAEMLGGTPIEPNTTDTDERKVLNVVEEMSIASGVPVPRVYLLKDEQGINAFAAGFSTKDAVIGVTEGAVKLLSRDELQGVIGHEFSHIFNGDMRLNMYLTGILNGLLMIAVTGRLILHSRIRARGKSGGAVAVIYLVALLLVVVGYIGVFFCNIIKAAISQQREFLADASSVQYTRNPSGLAGALKKIGGLAEGSRVAQGHAEEASHFFFAECAPSHLSQLLSTHPPLEARIKLLDPQFDGTFPRMDSFIRRVLKKNPPVIRPSKRAPSQKTLLETFQFTSAVAQVGELSRERLDHANDLLSGIPADLRVAILEPAYAPAIVYGALIDRGNSDLRKQQLGYLSQNTDSATYQAVIRFLPSFTALAVKYSLPLVDLAMPALKMQSQKQYEAFRGNIEALIHIDKSVTVFEFALEQVVLHRLDFVFGKKKRGSVLFSDLRSARQACAVLLSYLAQTGHTHLSQAQAAFFAAARKIDSSHDWKWVSAGELSHDKLQQAITLMTGAAPMAREKFLEACEACVRQDEKLNVFEMELLRAFSAVLDSPMPPLLHAEGSSLKNVN